MKVSFINTLLLISVNPGEPGQCKWVFLHHVLRFSNSLLSAYVTARLHAGSRVLIFFCDWWSVVKCCFKAFSGSLTSPTVPCLPFLFRPLEMKLNFGIPDKKQALAQLYLLVGGFLKASHIWMSCAVAWPSSKFPESAKETNDWPGFQRLVHMVTVTNSPQPLH